MTEALNLDVHQSHVERRVLKVSHGLEGAMLQHLAPFGWSLTAQSRRVNPEGALVLTAAFGSRRDRYAKRTRYVEMHLQRAAGVDSRALDALEEAYVSLGDTEQLRERALAPLGCPMAIGVVGLAVAGLNVIYHGMNQTSQWALLLGVPLVVPFAVVWLRNQQSGSALEHQQDLRARREAIAREAWEVLRSTSSHRQTHTPAPPMTESAESPLAAEASDEASALTDVDPEMSLEPPRGSQACPFTGRIRAREDSRLFGALARAGDTVLMIDRDWRVWRKQDSQEWEWGWIDAHGEIHRGAMPDRQSPWSFQVGLDVVARVDGRRLFVGGQHVGRLVN